MSTSLPIAVERGATTLATRLADYLELTKPRIIMLELIVASIAACVATPHVLNMQTLLTALGGTALVAASASIANQCLERKRDARMPRTADRPVPAGRVTPREAALLSAMCLVVGETILIWQVNLLTAVLGMISWLLYTVVYTPLKTRTEINTPIGAIAGAIPLLMGWTATGAPLTLTAWSMVAVLFLWQFPHFMAIAWLYRKQYRLAGHRMLSVVDPSGLRAGAQAVLGATLLVPVSLIPAVVPTGGSPLFYLTWAFALGTLQVVVAMRFALYRNDTSARYLLGTSLIYLPTWLTLLLVVTL